MVSVYEIVEKGGLKCIMPKKMREGVRCYFTTRVGGTSTGAFSSMNLSFCCGDDALNVQKNLSILIKKLSLSFSFFVIPQQVHKDRCTIIDRDTLSAAPFLPLGEGLPYYVPVLETDALVTNLAKVALSVNVADCICAFFFDGERKVVAVAHLGWRALLNDIIKNVLKNMEELGARKENVRVFFSAAIGPCCYKLGEQLWRSLEEKGVEGLGEGYTLNLWDAFKVLLMREGVRSVDICPLCTCCNAHLFFSYRREKQTGRMMGVIYLEE